MSASFYERILQLGDWENDGGPVDVSDLQSQLILYEAGLMTAAEIASRYNCTVAQVLDVEEILGTMPTALLSAVQAAARARWSAKIGQVFKLGSQQDQRFDTVAEVKAAIGA